MTDQTVKGAKEAYYFLAKRFGGDFTSRYKWRTFQNKCVLNDVPYCYQERDHTPKDYEKAALIKWFEGGFSSGEVGSLK